MQSVQTIVFVSLALAVLLFGCHKKQSRVAHDEPKASDDTRISSQLLQRSEPSSGSALFRKLTPDETGVRFVNPLEASHPMRYLHHGATCCGGVAIGDVDGADRPDIFLLSGPRQNKLFRQAGRLRFEDVTTAAGITNDAWNSGATMIDIDNDDDLDIYVCNYDAPNQLFVNDGGAKGQSIRGWRSRDSLMRQRGTAVA